MKIVLNYRKRKLYKTNDEQFAESMKLRAQTFFAIISNLTENNVWILETFPFEFLKLLIEKDTEQNITHEGILELVVKEKLISNTEDNFLYYTPFVTDDGEPLDHLEIKMRAQKYFNTKIIENILNAHDRPLYTFYVSKLNKEEFITLDTGLGCRIYFPWNTQERSKIYETLLYYYHKKTDDFLSEGYMDEEQILDLVQKINQWYSRSSQN